MVRQGAVTRDGRGEAVVGIVMMLMGANSREVVTDAKASVEAMKPALAKLGVTIEPFYDRTELVKKTIHTVAKNLSEGGLLVIVVLFLMLRNMRAGLIVASAIPLSMLVAFLGMKWFGVSGNLMSLGAIDFGVIVDGAVIVIENSVRMIGERVHELGPAGDARRALGPRAPRQPRGRPLGHLRRGHHRHRLPADPFPDRHRRQDVPAHGHDGALRPGRRARPRRHLPSRPRLPGPSSRRGGEGERHRGRGPAGVPARCSLALSTGAG